MDAWYCPYCYVYNPSKNVRCRLCFKGCPNVPDPIGVKMTNTEELEDLADAPHRGWTPKVISGGKGPPDTPSPDWMTALEVGTTFVCRQNNTTVDGELYHLVFKGEQFFLLKYCLPDGKIWDRYVSPVSFCKIYKEYEVLGINKQEEREAPEGDSNVHEQRDLRRPPDVVFNEADQGDPEVS